MIENVELALIRADSRCQPRATLFLDVVEEYANDMAAGAAFPPVVVFHDGTEYWLADGFHRRQAAEVLGLTEIAADVRPGTLRDAILFSVSANAGHGMRRSNDDKRRAVTTLLADPEWARWSDREIARQCSVSHVFVQNMRPRQPLSGNGFQIEPRTVSRGGTTYTMNTGNIGGSSSEPPLPFGAPQSSAGIDLSASHLWHALRDAIAAIQSLPSPAETAARFPRVLEHAVRAEDVSAAAAWLSAFAALWEAGQAERDRRTAELIQRAREIRGNVAI
jgi:hypothetical protein